MWLHPSLVQTLVGPPHGASNLQTKLLPVQASRMTPDTLHQQSKCELLPSCYISFPWVLYLSKQPALVAGAFFSLFHISTTIKSQDSTTKEPRLKSMEICSVLSPAPRAVASLPSAGLPAPVLTGLNQWSTLAMGILFLNGQFDLAICQIKSAKRLPACLGQSSSSPSCPGSCSLSICCFSTLLPHHALSTLAFPPFQIWALWTPPYTSEH